jgi:hypothetical protein
MGCYELGWYLSLASMWNAHNNECGAAARIDKYRHFVRFKVTPSSITGYVIAVDQPVSALVDIRARVVDVFAVQPRRP